MEPLLLHEVGSASEFPPSPWFRAVQIIMGHWEPRAPWQHAVRIVHWLGGVVSIFIFTTINPTDIGSWMATLVLLTCVFWPAWYVRRDHFKRLQKSAPLHIPAIQPYTYTILTQRTKMFVVFMALLILSTAMAGDPSQPFLLLYIFSVFYSHVGYAMLVYSLACSLIKAHVAVFNVQLDNLAYAMCSSLRADLHLQRRLCGGVDEERELTAELEELQEVVLDDASTDAGGFSRVPTANGGSSPVWSRVPTINDSLLLRRYPSPALTLPNADKDQTYPDPVRLTTLSRRVTQLRESVDQGHGVTLNTLVSLDSPATGNSHGGNVNGTTDSKDHHDTDVAVPEATLGGVSVAEVTVWGVYAVGTQETLSAQLSRLHAEWGEMRRMLIEHTAPLHGYVVCVCACLFFVVLIVGIDILHEGFGYYTFLIQVILVGLMLAILLPPAMMTSACQNLVRRAVEIRCNVPSVSKVHAGDLDELDALIRDMTVAPAGYHVGGHLISFEVIQRAAVIMATVAVVTARLGGDA